MLQLLLRGLKFPGREPRAKENPLPNERGGIMEMDAEMCCVLTKYRCANKARDSWLAKGFLYSLTGCSPCWGGSQPTRLPFPSLPSPWLSQNAIPERLGLWKLETLLKGSVLLLKACQLKCKKRLPLSTAHPS